MRRAPSSPPSAPRLVAIITLTLTLTLALALALPTTELRAHVSPSVDDNNRYVKLSPQADRLRVAYTVFFGEVPGASLRPTLDTNHDNTISDAEAQTYGDRVAADVLAALELSIDNQQQRFGWKNVTVGMGSPAVAGAGSFSIDMIAYVCLPSGGDRHTALLRDRFRVPKPGETEVRVEDSLGIEVEVARIAGSDALANDFKFVGPGGPLSDEGLHVAFVVTDKAPRSGACASTASSQNGDRVPWLAIGIGALAVLLGVGALIRKIQRAK